MTETTVRTPASPSAARITSPIEVNGVGLSYSWTMTGEL